MKKILIRFLLAAAFLCLSSATSLAVTHNVSIIDNAFSPSNITINVGDTVVWTHNGFVQHTTTSGSGCSHNTTGVMWDSGLMSNGQTFQVTFNQAGTFDYFCSIHCFSGMTGAITVNAAPSTIPLPTTFATFSYPAIVAPVLSSVPMQSQPVGVGSVAMGGGILSIEVALNQFAGPVDVYFLLFFPAIDPVNIYQLTSLGTFQTTSAGLAPWMPNVQGPISQGLFGDVATMLLPGGQYILAVFVTPAGDQSLTKGYLWITSFTL